MTFYFDLSLLLTSTLLFEKICWSSFLVLYSFSFARSECEMEKTMEIKTPEIDIWALGTWSQSINHTLTGIKGEIWEVTKNFLSFQQFLLKDKNADSDICEQTTLIFCWSLLLRVLFVNFSALISIHQGPTTHSNFKTFRSKGRWKDVLKTHHQSKNLLSSRKRQSWI